MSLNEIPTNGEIISAPHNQNYALLSDTAQQIYDNFEQLSISVTTTSSSDTYASTMTSHVIKNIGTTNCYINFDAAATTSSILLRAKETRVVLGSIDAIHAITATGTTTVRIIGQV